MSNPWNEPPPQLDNAFRSRIIDRTNDYLSMVTWRQNGNPTNLKEAVAMAKQGKDGGEELTLSFRPTNNCFHAWMDWSSLVTYLYNRDTQVRTLLSAIRKTIILS